MVREMVMSRGVDMAMTRAMAMARGMAMEIVMERATATATVLSYDSQ